MVIHSGILNVLLLYHVHITLVCPKYYHFLNAYGHAYINQSSSEYTHSRLISLFLLARKGSRSSVLFCQQNENNIVAYKKDVALEIGKVLEDI